jgi:hypothetical protein
MQREAETRFESVARSLPGAMFTWAPSEVVIKHDLATRVGMWVLAPTACH